MTTERDIPRRFRRIQPLREPGEAIESFLGLRVQQPQLLQLAEALFFVVRYCRFLHRYLSVPSRLRKDSPRQPG